MGACCSSQDSERSSFNDQSKPRQSTVGLGVAMMMQQASMFAGTNTHFDVIGLEGRIRKAKAEGRTVTLVNGSLYFDYQHVANVPPNINLRDEELER